jgi:RimJ/RimL family protein N-acetyltransferase
VSGTTGHRDAGTDVNPPDLRGGPTLRTERLVLRPWRESDLEPFAALNADDRVTRTLAGSLDRAASDAMAARFSASFEKHGFGYWAVELPGVAPFVGALGLSVPAFDAAFMPAVEIGWRLAFDHWGKGYATEGAKAALDFGFDDAGLAEIVSFTAASNTRSRAVMERLGMRTDPKDDFNHVKLGPAHPLYHHVLYRLRREDWRAR